MKDPINEAINPNQPNGEKPEEVFESSVLNSISGLMIDTMIEELGNKRKVLF
jgi:hypothetical protein